MITFSLVWYGGFGRIGGLGGSSGVCAPSSTCSLNAIVLVSLGIKRIGGDASLALICLSIIGRVVVGIEGVYRFSNFALPLRWVRGRAVGLGNWAGVLYSSVANGQRLASVMVIGLPAAYAELLSGYGDCCVHSVWVLFFVVTKKVWWVYAIVWRIFCATFAWNTTMAKHARMLMIISVNNQGCTWSPWGGSM